MQASDVERGDAMSELSLSLADIRQSWRQGFFTAKGYLYYLLMFHHSTGELLLLESVSQFCQRWEMTESEFDKARKALIALGVLGESLSGYLELVADEPEPGPSMPVLGDLIAETLGAQPEQQSDDWVAWYREAQQRGLVLAAQRQGDRTLVYTSDDRWRPLEQLRGQSWEALEAMLQPTVAKVDDAELTPEQQKILAAMRKLAGGLSMSRIFLSPRTGLVGLVCGVAIAPALTCQFATAIMCQVATVGGSHGTP